MKSYPVLLVILLIVLFIFRVYQTGGLHKPEPDPFLTELAVNFIPFREELALRIDQILPEPQSKLLSGILLGVQSSLPRELKKALQNTSVIHIVVVSGQNLTLIAGFLISLVTLLGRKKTVILTLTICLLYALLTGLQIPVIRALLMAFFAYLAQILGKERTSWWILLLSAYLMLLYNPSWLLSISFQLSFSATVGVVVVSPVLIKHLKCLPDLIKQDLAVSFSATLLTAPIIAINFHQLSMIGILVNSLILWIVSPVMILGIIALGLSFIWLPLAVLAGYSITALLTYFIYIVGFFNSLPFSVAYVGKVNPLIWVGYYILVGGMVWIFSTKSKLKS